MKNKTLFVAAALACLGASAGVRAEDAAYAISGNLTLSSDYLFRGLTQTWGGPAIQGGADLTTSAGFAAGVWASSISDRSYPGASLELDLYASYGRPIDADWSWRVGLYGYLYPRGDLDRAGLPSRSFDTLEANASLSWKWLTLKYSHALTDYFGVDVEQGYRGDSRGAGYVQLDAAIPLDAKWSLALHAGHTRFGTRLAAPNADGADDPDYTDLGATLKYQFHPRWSASLGLSRADNGDFYGRTASFANAADTRDTGGARGFVALQGVF